MRRQKEPWVKSDSAPIPTQAKNAWSTAISPGVNLPAHKIAGARLRLIIPIDSTLTAPAPPGGPQGHWFPGARSLFATALPVLRQQP